MEYSNGFTKFGHLSSEVETQHYFPGQEWAHTKLPMSEVWFQRWKAVPLSRISPETLP